MLRDMATGLGRALFPARCAACDARGEPLCPGCRAGLVAACAGPPPAGVERLVAAFVYGGAAREVIARVKYRDARHAIGFLADAVAARAGTVAGHAGMVVTWPPTTATRRRARGFDHAELLARAVARRLVLPAAGLLLRLDGDAQTGRGVQDRRVGPRFASRPDTRAHHVLLVDDVVTTGATLACAARTLRRAGSLRVVAAVAARTPPPGLAPQAERTTAASG